jgi:hypothetical protein
MALFFTYVLPLLLPTAIYVLWRLISAPRPADGGANRASDEAGGAAALAVEDLWRDAPWPWLALAGVLLLALVLLVGVFFHGAPQQGHYVPPRMEDGRIVPGELRLDDAGSGRPAGPSSEAPGSPRAAPSEAR